jgi:hypothetical protein
MNSEWGKNRVARYAACVVGLKSSLLDTRYLELAEGRPLSRIEHQASRIA